MIMTEKLQNKAWKSLSEEYKKEIKEKYNLICRTSHNITTLENLWWLFGIQNLTEDDKAEEEKRERETYERLKKKYEG